jgi:flagellar motor switch protein FliN
MANQPDNQGLSQADIDAALAGMADAEGGGGGASAPAGGETISGMLSQADVDAALKETGAGDPTAAGVSAPIPDTRTDSMGRPFDEAAAAMAAAIAEESARARTVTLPEFDKSGDEKRRAWEDLQHEIALLNDVNLHVKIELGRSRMLVEDVLRLGQGSVVELDKLAGDPVDVYVNERLVARGEVLVLNDNFCVRISEILGGIDGHELASTAAK